MVITQQFVLLLIILLLAVIMVVVEVVEMDLVQSVVLMPQEVIAI